MTLAILLAIAVHVLHAEARDEFRKGKIGALSESFDAEDKGVDARSQSRHFGLKLEPSETAKRFSVYVQNDHPEDLEILGVQTSLGLYVASIPRKIPGNGRARFTLVWSAGNGAGNVIEFLRVATPVGEKVVQIEPQQEEVVDFETREINWPQNGPAETKVVKVSCKKGFSVVSATAAGEGTNATVEARGAGIFYISINPGSVALRRVFPVVVKFEPTVIGVPTVIRCSVGE